MKDYEGRRRRWEEEVVGGRGEVDGTKDRDAERGQRRKRERQLENEPGRWRRQKI